MFEIGKQYSRKNDIHKIYGGQENSGISTPSAHPFIFLFSGTSGSSFGYADKRRVDNVFEYSGEGQIGDMTFTSGNKAVRDHALNGKELHLFESLGKGKPVVYVGQFDCASYEFDEGPDREDNSRQTIIFHLVSPSETAQSVTGLIKPTKVTNLATLKAKAYNALSPTPKKSTASVTTRRERDEAVRTYILARAAGVCEYSGERGPFISKETQTPFLEVHHIKRLSDNGLDHPINCAAVTPNVHREIHSGVDGALINEKLIKIVSEKELND